MPELEGHLSSRWLGAEGAVPSLMSPGVEVLQTLALVSQLQLLCPGCALLQLLSSPGLSYSKENKWRIHPQPLK